MEPEDENPTIVYSRRSHGLENVNFVPFVNVLRDGSCPDDVPDGAGIYPDSNTANSKNSKPKPEQTVSLQNGGNKMKREMGDVGDYEQVWTNQMI